LLYSPDTDSAIQYIIATYRPYDRRILLVILSKWR